MVLKKESFLQMNMMQIRPIEEIATVKYIIDEANERGDKVVKFTTKHQKKNGEIIEKRFFISSFNSTILYDSKYKKSWINSILDFL